MAAYTPTNYVNGQAPAINATDLNHLTAELVLQAADPVINTSTFLTSNYWVNGSTHAVSDPTGLNEMERIISLVAAHFSLQYTPTTWQTGWVPARNATRLNNMELQTQTNRAQLDIPPGQQLPVAPTGLVVTPGDHQLTLTWAANPAGDNVDAYQVYEGNPSSWFDNTWLTRPVSPRSYVMTTDHLGAALVPGVTYEVRVGAHNSAGYGPWSVNSVTGVPTGTPPPPSNRYLDVNFSTGLYRVIGDPNDFSGGGASVFEAYLSDARLSDWGGLPHVYYDNPGAFGYSPPGSMTTDQNQRIYLFHPASRGLPANPQGGSTWASWHELRTTDSSWANEATNPGTGRLSKSTLKFTSAYTLGPGGWSPGMVRWFAVDILFPLNINTGVSANGTTTVSFEAWNSGFGQTLGMLHDSGSTGSAPAEFRLLGPNPYTLNYSQTPNQAGGSGVPYIDVPMIDLWNSSGARIAANFNVWHEIVIGTKMSLDSTGWFEVWFNGVQKGLQTGRQIVAAGEAGPYFMMQNYTEHPVTFVGGAQRHAVVFGGCRIGLTRADVQTR